jgi:cytochrome c-550 PedF
MRNRTPLHALLLAISMTAAAGANLALAHGDVTPQPINVTGLKPLKEGEWLTQNPYLGDPAAIEIGSSGYNQNCARCHGLQVISGGLAPDLRYLEKGQVGDEWFIERIRHGARKSDGSTVMPAFEGIFSQEAMWAIRAYIESMHEDN